MSDRRPSLLLQLSESCTRHQSHHEKNRLSSYAVDDEGHVPEFCQQGILGSLRKILPKVEVAYRADKSPSAKDVGHMCDFFLQVIDGSFCPHAPHLLKLGRGATEGACV
jgi:hypothetical protein